MTDALKAAARAGDPKALEALMNKSFDSKGITVRVTNSGSLLRVALRGTTAPDKGLLTLIRKGLGGIKPAGFNKVIVTAKAMGKGESWSEQWELAESRPAEPLTASAPPSPSSASKILVSSERPTPLYQKSWLIIVMLMVFPPGGIALAWVSQWPKAIKIGVSVVSGFWLLLIVTQQLNKSLQTITQESTQTPATELVTEAEPQAVVAPEPPPDRTFADAVNQAMAASGASHTKSFLVTPGLEGRVRFAPTVWPFRNRGCMVRIWYQAAVSKDDWDNVANLWDAAILQMKSVPASNANYATAQLKASEYQTNLDYAKDRSIALSPNLGINKSDLRYTFSQLGTDLLFKDAPLTDGTPRLLGTSPDNLVMVELYGSTNLVTKATMMTFIGQGVPADLLALYNVTFLDEVAPGYNWNAQLSETLSEISPNNFEGFSEEETLQAGDKVVSVSLSEISGIAVLIVSVEPD